jgi:ADP-heptose:LPS heptosyltransferase
LASAFHTPQIALFGPTNPFHWRPRHPAVQILSATHPSAPLTTFHPKMRGASTDQISTTLVIDAIAPLYPLASI